MYKSKKREKTLSFINTVTTYVSGDWVFQFDCLAAGQGNKYQRISDLKALNRLAQLISRVFLA